MIKSKREKEAEWPRRMAVSSAKWQSFAHQQAALEHADSLPVGDDPQVWALEHGESGGKRTYLVASRAAFWQRYRMIIPPHRNYYEVIRCGRPCHLYFDVEYCRLSNPRSDGEAMVATLCREVRAALGRSFYDGACPENMEIIDLDSSTTQKFSRHLIIRLDGAAFEDNSQCGYFVRQLCANWTVRRAAEPGIAALFVKPGAAGDAKMVNTGAISAPSDQSLRPSSIATTDVSFVDQSVYSRNRCFRLYKSCKAGKSAPFLLAGCTADEECFMPHAQEQELFFKTLVTNVAPDHIRLLHVQRHGVAHTNPASAGEERTEGGRTVLPILAPLPAELPSGYAQVIHFVLGAWSTKTGLPSHARSLSFEPDRLTLNLADNRWCAHLQRAHRSNGTLLRIDLRRQCFAQFCFDFECRKAGFHGSDELPVPSALCADALAAMAASDGEWIQRVATRDPAVCQARSASDQPVKGAIEQHVAPPVRLTSSHKAPVPEKSAPGYATVALADSVRTAIAGEDRRPLKGGMAAVQESIVIELPAAVQLSTGTASVKTSDGVNLPPLLPQPNSNVARSQPQVVPLPLPQPTGDVARLPTQPVPPPLPQRAQQASQATKLSERAPAVIEPCAKGFLGNASAPRVPLAMIPEPLPQPAVHVRERSAQRAHGDAGVAHGRWAMAGDCQRRGGVHQRTMGRTPSKEDTPCRGREHPAATPSPILASHLCDGESAAALREKITSGTSRLACSETERQPAAAAQTFDFSSWLRQL